MGKAILALVLLLQAADDKGATKHDRTLKMLIPLLSSDVTDVRAAAATALAGFGDWKKLVTPSLQGAMQSNAKDPKAQKAILTALGKLADPLGLPTIHGNFREPSMTVTTAAIEASGLARQKESMDALLELQKEVQKWLKNKQGGPYRKDDGQQGSDEDMKNRLETIQKLIIKAFQDITKEKWATANEWEIWWGKKKANFEIPK